MYLSKTSTPVDGVHSVSAPQAAFSIVEIECYRTYTNYFRDASLLVERAVDQSSLLNTNVPIWFATKHWNFLLSNLEDAYENLVKVFYANVTIEGKEIRCWVKGKRFSVTPVYLADILQIKRPILPIPPVYDELNPDQEVLREALGPNLEFSSNGKSISVAALSPKLRLLTMIMFSNLYLLSSTGYMNLGRALFLHDLIIDVEINVCSYIFHIFAKTIDWTASRNCIPFCRLISRILKLKGVHPLENERLYPRPSLINIRTLHASMSHTKKSTKHESHATPGSSSSTAHVYDEQFDNIIATLQEITTRISGLASIMHSQHIRFDTKFTSLQTQLDQIQR
ncbi:hypothetical protein SO802_029012 [Lithocarpus litseifolius]|uniref:Putative plant transposon protein domain-containing protein n=1 Tax=Lithocarpus litseifolius TaxID=425828 RepID=A0AAW2BTU3_9ROSI